MEAQRHLIARAIPHKNNAGGIRVPDLLLRNHLKSMFLAQKTQLYNRVDVESAMNPHSAANWFFFFYKDAKIIPWKKRDLFHKWCEENWLPMCGRVNLGPCLSSSRKVNVDLPRDLATWRAANQHFTEISVVRQWRNSSRKCVMDTGWFFFQP